jgi:2-oxoglutarate ferredoxin oxidoreductase subunit gamma
MSLGRLIAYTGMLQGLEVSWLPSYGPEMRGGTANCHVIVSERSVGSPILVRDADAALVLNLPSMHKFENELIAGGLLVVNRSLIEAEPTRGDVRVVAVRANEIAAELGNAKAANMVMLGAYLAASQLFPVQAVSEALAEVFGPKKAAFVPLNEAALERGARVVVGAGA